MVDRDSCGVGFIARIDGEPTRAIVADGLLALRRLTHRGAPESLGSVDGCGVMTAIPWRHLEREDGVRVPAGPCRALGMCFVGDADRAAAVEIVERELRV